MFSVDFISIIPQAVAVTLHENAGTALGVFHELNIPELFSEHYRSVTSAHVASEKLEFLLFGGGVGWRRCVAGKERHDFRSGGLSRSASGGGQKDVGCRRDHRRGAQLK